MTYGITSEYTYYAEKQKGVLRMRSLINYITENTVSVWQLRFSLSRVNCQYFEMNFSYSTPNTHTLTQQGDHFSQVKEVHGNYHFWRLSPVFFVTIQISVSHV